MGLSDYATSSRTAKQAHADYQNSLREEVVEAGCTSSPSLIYPSTPEPHMPARLTGLVAATYTPMQPDNAIDPAAIHALADQLIADGVEGLYVCGSTGELMKQG